MPYLPLKEAADRLGVSIDTLRRRIKDDAIPARQTPIGSGFRWEVEVPDDPEPSPGETVPPADGVSAEALELERLREEVKGLERLLTEVSGERDHWRETAQHAQGLARVNAETVQRLAERAQPPALPPGGPESGSPSKHTGTGTQTPSGGRESLRERLRRWWQGGQ